MLRGIMVTSQKLLATPCLAPRKTYLLKNRSLLNQIVASVNPARNRGFSRCPAQWLRPVVFPMKKLPAFPEVSADEQTPWVMALLGIIEKLRIMHQRRK